MASQIQQMQRQQQTREDSFLDQLRRSFDCVSQAWLSHPQMQSSQPAPNAPETVARLPTPRFSSGVEDLVNFDANGENVPPSPNLAGCLSSLILHPSGNAQGFNSASFPAPSRLRPGVESPVAQTANHARLANRIRRRDSRGISAHRSTPKSRSSFKLREEEFKRKAIQISGELNALATQLSEEHVLNPKVHKLAEELDELQVAGTLRRGSSPTKIEQRLSTIWAQSRILQLSYQSMSTSGSGTFPFGLKGSLHSSGPLTNPSPGVSLELPRGAPASTYAIERPAASPVSPDSSVRLQSATGSPAGPLTSPAQRPSAARSSAPHAASPAKRGSSARKPPAGPTPKGQAPASSGRPSRVLVAERSSIPKRTSAEWRTSERLRMQEQLEKEKDAVRILMDRLQEEMTTRAAMEKSVAASQELLGHKDLVLAQMTADFVQLRQRNDALAEALRILSSEKTEWEALVDGVEEQLNDIRAVCDAEPVLSARSSASGLRSSASSAAAERADAAAAYARAVRALSDAAAQQQQQAAAAPDWAATPEMRPAGASAGRPSPLSYGGAPVATSTDGSVIFGATSDEASSPHSRPRSRQPSAAARSAASTGTPPPPLQQAGKVSDSSLLLGEAGRAAFDSTGVCVVGPEGYADFDTPEKLDSARSAGGRSLLAARGPFQSPLTEKALRWSLNSKAARGPQPETIPELLARVSTGSLLGEAGRAAFDTPVAEGRPSASTARESTPAARASMSAPPSVGRKPTPEARASAAARESTPFRGVSEGSLVLGAAMLAALQSPCAPSERTQATDGDEAPEDLLSPLASEPCESLTGGTPVQAPAVPAGVASAQKHKIDIASRIAMFEGAMRAKPAPPPPAPAVKPLDFSRRLVFGPAAAAAAPPAVVRSPVAVPRPKAPLLTQPILLPSLLEPLQPAAAPPPAPEPEPQKAERESLAQLLARVSEGSLLFGDAGLAAFGSPAASQPSEEARSPSVQPLPASRCEGSLFVGVLGADFASPPSASHRSTGTEEGEAEEGASDLTQQSEAWVTAAAVTPAQTPAGEGPVSKGVLSAMKYPVDVASKIALFEPERPAPPRPAPLAETPEAGPVVWRLGSETPEGGEGGEELAELQQRVAEIESLLEKEQANVRRLKEKLEKSETKEQNRATFQNARIQFWKTRAVKAEAEEKDRLKAQVSALERQLLQATRVQTRNPKAAKTQNLAVQTSPGLAARYTAERAVGSPLQHAPAPAKEGLQVHRAPLVPLPRNSGSFR